MDNVMYDLKDLIKKELQKVVDKRDISPSEMESTYYAVCAMEKICDIEKDEEEMYNLKSSEKKFSMWYDNDASNRRVPGNMPYLMSRDAYPHRDPMIYNRYENDSSNHSIKDRMIDSLERMMDTAGSEYERQQIQEQIRNIRNSENR